MKILKNLKSVLIGLGGIAVLGLVVAFNPIVEQNSDADSIEDINNEVTILEVKQYENSVEWNVLDLEKTTRLEKIALLQEDIDVLQEDIDVIQSLQDNLSNINDGLRTQEADLETEKASLGL